MEFYELHLDKAIWYARHAMSIDENRADFARVPWGSSRNRGPARPEEYPDWLEQVWFAGNHSDIGGSYAENEARLSDIPLEWMLRVARNLPDGKSPDGYGVKVDFNCLKLNPDPLGQQHDEREPGWFGGRFKWEEGLREIQVAMNPPIKRVEFVRKYLDGVFAEDIHAKRVMSLANGALGVMTNASLAMSIIGQSLAQSLGLVSKHAIKQVDRLLSNRGIVVRDMFAPWVGEVVGERKAIVVAMDWTDFDAVDQATLALSLVTNQGRATPLLWLTVLKDELKNSATTSKTCASPIWPRRCPRASP